MAPILLSVLSASASPIDHDSWRKQAITLIDDWPTCVGVPLVGSLRRFFFISLLIPE